MELELLQLFLRGRSKRRKSRQERGREKKHVSDGANAYFTGSSSLKVAS